MPRTILDTELEELRKKVIQLGSLVENALAQALSALQANDLVLCSGVIEADAAIDTLRTAIEQQTFRLLTLQQPLGGQDLRFLTSLFSIVGDLERIGDGAAGIAQMLVRMVPLSQQVSPLEKTDQHASLAETALVQGLYDLGKEAHRVFEGTMQAFATKNVQAARYLWEEDDVVDVRYHLVRHDLMQKLSGVHAIPAVEQDEYILQRVTYYLWMAHKWERVADHCTNICERIVFILEGETAIHLSSSP